MNEREPLPDDWEQLDSIGCYYEWMAVLGEQVRAGLRELPECFRPSRERAE